MRIKNVYYILMNNFNDFEIKSHLKLKNILTIFSNKFKR